MFRRSFLARAMAVGTTVLAPLSAAAQVLRSRLVVVSVSVGDHDKVRFDGTPGHRFTLRNSDGREDEIAAEANGRQRIELRDVAQDARGTMRYSMKFMVPEMNDPDGRLEAKFIFFQIKPDHVRNIGFIPYVSIMVPRDYRREGFHVDFDFPDNRHITTNTRLRIGSWHDIQFVIRWSKAADGFADVIVDGARIARHTGPTGPDGGAAYPNFGIYRSHMNRTDPQKVEDLTVYIKDYVVERLA